MVWPDQKKKSLGSKLKSSNITLDLNMSFLFFKKNKVDNNSRYLYMQMLNTGIFLMFDNADLLSKCP